MDMENLKKHLNCSHCGTPTVEVAEPSVFDFRVVDGKLTATMEMYRWCDKCEDMRPILVEVEITPKW